MKRGAQISEFGHNAQATNIIFPQGGVLLAIEAGREGGVYGSSWLFSFSVISGFTWQVLYMFYLFVGVVQIFIFNLFHFIHIFIQLESTR